MVVADGASRTEKPTAPHAISAINENVAKKDISNGATQIKIVDMSVAGKKQTRKNDAKNSAAGSLQIRIVFACSNKNGVRFKKAAKI